MRTLVLRLVHYFYPQTSTKALLGLQRRVRELEEELQESKKENDLLKKDLKAIHDTVKEATNRFWWAY
jgi:peptidoglycan hydrolase CwlO-like protein